MSDTDDDEQLKEAIALSLQDGPFRGKETDAGQDVEYPRRVIDLTSSPPAGASKHSKPKDVNGASTMPESKHTVQAESFGIFGLNRKEMEEQRLARKRKTSISPPPARRQRQKSNATNVDASSSIAIPSSHLRKGTLQYPKGVVKKTWAYGFPREEDIKIEEVLRKPDLQLAVLSAFQWDVEWLLRKINIDTTKMIFVMEAKEDEVVS